MPGILDGIRVFDLTLAGAGPLASQMLAELGADVIKIEAPGDGDVMRGRPPTQRGVSVGYSHYNRGKRSAVFDLRDADDRQLAFELLSRCDVFVNNMRPGVAERLGLGYPDLRALNPGIVYGYLSAWGRTGPLAAISGADPVVQFFSGYCSLQGEVGGRGEFSRHVGHIDASGATLLAGGIVQGLIHRAKTGRGLRVDVSLLEASLGIQLTRLAEYFGGGTPGPLGSACGTTVPHQAFLCGDGQYLAVGVLNDDHWRGLCQALGLGELRDDPRFATNPERVRHRAELIPILDEAFFRGPTNWWQILLERHGVPHGRFYDWENIRYHTQVEANACITEFDLPDQGRLYLSNPPWEFGELEHVPLVAPRPGEHTTEIRGWLRECLDLRGAQPGRSELEAESGGDDGVSERALAGLTVVDATQGLCGPYVSLLLADAGATVIKVEPPEGDYARRIGPPFIGEESAVFLALNRSKRSVVLDLSGEADRATLRKLVDRADIFLEDWGPGEAESRGLGYELLRTRNPGLVHGAITAFGERGPLRSRPGAELVIQAMTEYHKGIGPYSGPPLRTGADVANTNTATAAFYALAAAVYHRLRTGKGQRVSTSQFGTLLYTRGTVWAAQGDPDQWDGWAARLFRAPEFGYRAKDGSIYFFLLRGDQEQFDKLLIELGMEEYLFDPRFQGGGRDSVGIGKYGEDVRPIWDAVFKQLTIAELTSIGERYGAVVVPFYDYESLFKDPRVVALDLVKAVDHPKVGAYRSLGVPWRFSAFDDLLGSAPPELGQHSEEILPGLGSEATATSGVTVDTKGVQA